MMVSEYLHFFANIYGVKNAKEKINNLLRKLNLPDKFIGDLSKGMRRKVSIARTLLHNPEILIYDEPTGGLDPSTSLMIAELLRELAGRGKIIIFSAHNMYYVEKIADKVIIMKDGEALYYGSLEKLMNDSTIYRVKYVLNGKKHVAEVSEISELLKLIEKININGGTVLEIDKDVPRLENVYFSLISKTG